MCTAAAQATKLRLERPESLPSLGAGLDSLEAGVQHGIDDPASHTGAASSGHRGPGGGDRLSQATVRPTGVQPCGELLRGGARRLLAASLPGGQRRPKSCRRLVERQCGSSRSTGQDGSHRRDRAAHDANQTRSRGAWCLQGCPGTEPRSRGPASVSQGARDAEA